MVASVSTVHASVHLVSLDCCVKTEVSLNFTPTHKRQQVLVPYCVSVLLSVQENVWMVAFVLTVHASVHLVSLDCCVKTEVSLNFNHTHKCQQVLVPYCVSVLLSVQENVWMVAFVLTVHASVHLVSLDCCVKTEVSLNFTPTHKCRQVLVPYCVSVLLSVQENVWMVASV